MAIAFPVNSRYFGTGTSEYTSPDGRTYVYLNRRFLPPGESLELLEEHTVQEHERLDQIAFQHFGDPVLYWHICDANDAMKPADLLEPAGGQPRRLRITLPQGVRGPVQ
jgi:hypothetical protein